MDFETAPTLVEVPAELSKGNHPYFTFLGPEGTEYLAAYLRERAEEGETIEPETPIIMPRKVPKPFIRTINVGDLLRRPMHKAGVREPPYIWRSYFSNRAMNVEFSGLLKDWREFFMDHKGASRRPTASTRSCPRTPSRGCARRMHEPWSTWRPARQPSPRIGRRSSSARSCGRRTIRSRRWTGWTSPPCRSTISRT